MAEETRGTHPVFDELVARKSVRAFEDREIPDDVRTRILEAAFQAPTAGNQQLYSVIDVRAQEVRERLAELCDHQGFIAKAKMVLVFVADCEKWHAAYEEAGIDARPAGPGDLLLSFADAAIAAQNAVVAAWAEGVGSCYIGDVLEQHEEMRALLKLPAQVMPAVMLVFGYPTEQQMRRPKPLRMPAACVVMEDAYQPLSGEELRAMLASRVGARGYEEWVRAFHDRKYASDFAAEMNRSASRYLEEFGVGGK